MHERPRAISRRAVAQMLLAAPAAAALAQEKPAEQAPEKPSALAEFIAADEAGLSAAERERLKKSVGDTEQALAVIRGFKLPPDTAPAVRFQALKSKRS
jgi:hypothetical protein